MNQAVVLAGSSPTVESTPKSTAKFWQSTLSAASGYQSGKFDWNIPNGNESPNIVSELTWDDLDIWTNALQFEALGNEKWMIQLGFSYGEILDGRNRDSDYLFDDRGGEFSRSYADVDGHTLSARAMLGYRFNLLDGRLSLTPALGYAFDQQQFEDSNGYQAINRIDGYTGSFPGLDSSYETEWHAGVVDLGLAFRLTKRVELLGGGSFAMGSYDADAVWNLRDDLRQNPSFRHSADGYGASARLGLRYQLADAWFIHGMATYQTQWTDGGQETIYFREGSQSNGFNEATWESLGFAIGVDFRF